MPSSRRLKNKIRTVENVKQITKAMQMVSATKMRKSQEVALRARPFAKKSFALLLHLLKQADREEMESIFFQKRKGDKIGLVVITSDKGLAGSFNSSVVRKAVQTNEELDKEGFVEIAAVGRKGRDFFKARHAVIAAEFLQFSDVITYSDVKPLADWIVQAYEEYKYDKIVVCSNQFVSALEQKVQVRQLLPFGIDTLQKTIEGIIPKIGKYAELAAKEQYSQTNNRELSYVLEPSREAILQTLVRNLVQVMITYFVFESNAAEHSARMIAMKNATENANSLQEQLQLALNKARQSAITQELTEIATAKEALTAD